MASHRTGDSSPPDQQEIMVVVRRRLADVLMCAEEEIDLNRPVAELGLSSLQSLILIGELEDWLGTTLPATLVADGASVGELATDIRHHVLSPGAGGEVTQH